MHHTNNTKSQTKQTISLIAPLFTHPSSLELLPPSLSVVPTLPVVYVVSVSLTVDSVEKYVDSVELIDVVVLPIVLVVVAVVVVAVVVVNVVVLIEDVVNVVVGGNVGISVIHVALLQSKLIPSQAAAVSQTMVHTSPIVQ